MARIYTHDVISISDVNWNAMMIECIYRVSVKGGWRRGGGGTVDATENDRHEWNL